MISDRLLACTQVGAVFLHDLQELGIVDVPEGLFGLVFDEESPGSRATGRIGRPAKAGGSPRAYR